MVLSLSWYFPYQILDLGIFSTKIRQSMWFPCDFLTNLDGKGKKKKKKMGGGEIATLQKNIKRKEEKQQNLKRISYG